MIAALWLLALGASVIGYRIYLQKRLEDRYGDALVSYNAGAFKEILEPSLDERFLYVTKLAAEVESANGVKAIHLATEDRRLAIHQINKNGTFSTKGPYFVASSCPSNWRPTGATHLVKVLRAREGGFAPDHYDQSGIIREKGVAVLEYNTYRYRPLTIREFASQQTRTAVGKAARAEQAYGRFNLR
jgi:hypothetical protein